MTHGEENIPSTLQNYSKAKVCYYLALVLLELQTPCFKKKVQKGLTITPFIPVSSRATMLTSSTLHAIQV